MTKYKSCRIINGKPKNVVIDENGKIINKNPNKEELRNLRENYLGKYKDNRIKYSESELLDYLNRFYDLNGRVPLRDDFVNNPNYPSFRTIVYHFGSWGKGLIMAGLEPNVHPDYTSDELLEFLKDYYNETGKIPIIRDFIRNHQYPGFQIYINRFGSWNNALKLIGLDIDKAVKKGNLENNRQKGRLFELYVKEHFIEESIDLSGEKWTSPIDGICSKGKTYDAKSSSIKEGTYWQFHLNNIVDYYYLGAYNEDYTTLVHMWRIPGDFASGSIHIGILGSWGLNIENMRQYEIGIQN